MFCRIFLQQNSCWITGSALLSGDFTPQNPKVRKWKECVTAACILETIIVSCQMVLLQFLCEMCKISFLSQMEEERKAVVQEKIGGAECRRLVKPNVSLLKAVRFCNAHTCLSTAVQGDVPWDDRDFRYMAITVAGVGSTLLYFYFRDRGREITWKDFVHRYLSRGLVRSKLRYLSAQAGCFIFLSLHILFIYFSCRWIG